MQVDGILYTLSGILAESEVNALLRPLEQDFATVDDNLYKLYIGQYFRFDVRTLTLILPIGTETARCKKCAEQQDLVNVALFTTSSLLLPTGLRFTMALTIEVLRRLSERVPSFQSIVRLVHNDAAITILRKYREVTQFFKKSG